MKSYLITYDLKKSGQNYNALYDAIKSASYNDTWMHYLDSTWIIKSNLSVQQVSDKIKQAVDDNDSFIVIEVVKNYQGWLPTEAWDYLTNNIFN